MKKIISFKFNLQKRDILKHMKPYFPQGFSDEVLEQIDQITAAFLPVIIPATIYETYNKVSLPSVIQEIIRQQPLSHNENLVVKDNTFSGHIAVAENVQLALWEDCIAVTIAALSILSIPKIDLSLTPHVYEALCRSSMDGAMQFVYDLISDEADEEECILSSIITIEQSCDVQKIASLLDVSKIHITFDRQGAPQPAQSRFFMVSWNPKK